MPTFSETHEADIRIPFPDFHLKGELIIPANAAGVVLFADGSGMSLHQPRNEYVARTLRQHSVGTLVLDLLTEREFEEDRFTARLRSDVCLLAKRLLRATDWLHAREPDLFKGYFASVNASAAAFIADTQSDVPITAIVSRGGRPDLANDVLPLVKAATLLIVGGDDTPVIQLNQHAYERMTCSKEMRLIPGASDLLEEVGAQERVAEMAAEWFERHFVVPTGP